jgi:hypothetical protein
MSDESQLAQDMMQPWHALPKRLNPILQPVHMEAELQVMQFLGQFSQLPELRYLPGGQSVQTSADTEQATQFLLQARHDVDER